VADQELGEKLCFESLENRRNNSNLIFEIYTIFSIEVKAKKSLLFNKAERFVQADRSFVVELCFQNDLPYASAR
jgi:hypothetical protein